MPDLVSPGVQRLWLLLPWSAQEAESAESGVLVSPHELAGIEEADVPTDPHEDEEAIHLALVAGLVGGHKALYHHNAFFHAQIDTLVSALPSMIDGLAVHAVAKGEELRGEVERLMQANNPIMYLDEETWLKLRGVVRDE